MELRHYGNHLCFSCSLTVAEFVNGGFYAIPHGPGYYHQECLSRVLTLSNSITLPINQGGKS